MLIDQILKVYGFKEGLTVTSDNKITDWPYDVPIPDDDLIQELITDAERDMKINIYIYNTQQHINNKAKEKDYQDGYACASYANSTNATWKQEATDFIAWRDSVWSYAYNILSQVENGEIPPPSLVEFINNAPKLVWS